MKSARNKQGIKLPKLTPSTTTKRAPRHIVPKAELGLTVDLTFNWSAKHGHSDTDIVIKGSKSFSEVPPAEHTKLFIHKCTECKKICDFSSSDVDSKGKVTKTLLLKHLIQCFSMVGFLKMLTPELMKSFYEMVAANLFRTFPRFQSACPIDAKDSYFDQSWPHLSLVYQCLEASLNSSLTSTMTSSFIYNIVSNGVSLDSSERIAVRNFLHSFYARYMSQRIYVRRHIFGIFTMGMTSSELIDFYASVVQGFNPPLKSEHVSFFYQGLLPLFGHVNLVSFSNSLVACVSKFIEKGYILLQPTFEYLGKHWPCQDSKKQKAYLEIIRTFLVSFDTFTDESLTYAFTLLGDAVRNDNIDVSELALDILMDDNFAAVYKLNPTIIYSVLFEKLYKAAKNHWDENIRTDAVACLQILSEIDPDTFAKLNALRKEKNAKRNAAVKSVKDTWLSVFNSAKKNDMSVKTLKMDNNL